MLGCQTNAKSQVACISYTVTRHGVQNNTLVQQLEKELAPPFTHTLCKKYKLGVLLFIPRIATGAHTCVPNPSGLTFTHFLAHTDVLEFIGKHFFNLY